MKKKPGTDLVVPDFQGQRLSDVWDMEDKLDEAKELISSYIDLEITRLVREGWTQKAIAEECNRSTSTVSRRMSRLGIEATFRTGPKGPHNSRAGISRELEPQIVEVIEDDVEELDEEEELDDEFDDEIDDLDDEINDEEELEDEEEVEDKNGYYEKDTSDWRASLPDWETLVVKLTNTADRIESQLLAIEEREEREECAEHLAHHILWAKSMIKRLKK